MLGNYLRLMAIGTLDMNKCRQQSPSRLINQLSLSRLTWSTGKSTETWRAKLAESISSVWPPSTRLCGRRHFHWEVWGTDFVERRRQTHSKFCSSPWTNMFPTTRWKYIRQDKYRQYLTPTLQCKNCFSILLLFAAFSSIFYILFIPYLASQYFCSDQSFPV